MAEIRGDPGEVTQGATGIVRWCSKNSLVALINNQLNKQKLQRSTEGAWGDLTGQQGRKATPPQARGPKLRPSV